MQRMEKDELQEFVVAVRELLENIGAEWRKVLGVSRDMNAKAKKTEWINFRISKRLLQRFDRALEQIGMTRADWIRSHIMNFVEEYEKKEEERKTMRFHIYIPDQPEKSFTGTYEEAVEAFEEALWETKLLPDEECLSAADLGLAGGVTLEQALERDGFLRYGKAYIERV